MNYNLTRVQVYLDPLDLSSLDKIAKTIKLTRSQILRDLTKAVVYRYTQAFQLIGALEPKKKNALLELSGVEKSKTGRISSGIDEIYLQ